MNPLQIKIALAKLRRQPLGLIQCNCCIDGRILGDCIQKFFRVAVDQFLVNIQQGGAGRNYAQRINAVVVAEGRV